MAAARTALFSRHQPGGMFAVEDQSLSTGARLFVHSGTGTNGAGYGFSPDAPLATLGYAVGLCTASKGDIIYLMPGHAENIGSATACVLEVAGVKVQGIGWGLLRPTLTITTATTATISITAANCWIDNVRVVSNFLGVAASITIAGTADGTSLTNLQMCDTSVVLGSLIGISVAADADDLFISGLDYNQTALTAAATNVILCAGGSDRLRLVNSRIKGACTGAVVGATAAASTDIWVNDVTVINTDTTNGLGMAFHNSTTGFVDNVRSINLKNAVKGVTGTGLSIGPNVVYSNAVNAYAGLFSYTIDS